MTADIDPTLLLFSDEILFLILSNLDARSLARIRQACRRFRTIGSDRQLWKGQFVRSFPSKKHDLEESTFTSDEHSTLTSPTSQRRKRRRLKSVDASDWRLLYLLQHNWGEGRCSISSFSLPYRLSCVNSAASGRVYVASDNHLLICKDGALISTRDFRASISAVAVDDGTHERVLICLEDGSFKAVGKDGKDHAESSKTNSKIIAAAICDDMVVTYDKAKHLNIYNISAPGRTRRGLMLPSSAGVGPVAIHLDHIDTAGTYRIVLAFSVKTFPVGHQINLQQFIVKSTSSGMASDDFVPGSLVSFPSVFSDVECLKISPPHVVVAHKDHSVRVYTHDEDGVRLSGVLHGHTSTVTCVDISENGKVVSGGLDRSIRVWEPSDHHFLPHESSPSWKVTTLRDVGWDMNLDSRAGFVWAALDDEKVLSVFQTSDDGRDNVMKVWDFCDDWFPGKEKSCDSLSAGCSNSRTIEVRA